MDWLYVLGLAIRGTSFVLCWACVWQYARHRWQDDAIGRHLMAFMLVDAIILTLSVARAVGDPRWLQIVATVTFAAFPLVLAQRLWVFRRAQREGRAREASGS